MLNAANEIAVEAFLDRRLGFAEIPGVIEQTLAEHAGMPAATLEELLETDARARDHAARILTGVAS